MRRIRLILIIFVLLLGAGIYSAVHYAPRFFLVPLAPDVTGVPAALLPPDVLILHAADAGEVASPWRLAPAEDIAEDLALTIPVGAAVAAAPTRGALFTIKPAHAGRYVAWARVRWSNACANSCLLQVDQRTPFLFGQDGVYDVWHWVKAGVHDLSTNEHTLAIMEREAGVAVHQLLLTPDAGFIPRAVVLQADAAPDLRRFADHFERSPGHGIAPWSAIAGDWNINFSLDPNRIPLQYALVGTSGTNEPAIALTGETPWRGLRLAFNVYLPDNGQFGAVLEHRAESDPLQIVLATTDGGRELRVSRGEEQAGAPLPASLESGQWYRIAIERWAWMLRVYIDDALVFDNQDFGPANGQAGLTVADGRAVFDDVTITEIPWDADDGRTQRIAWVPETGAQWFRPRKKPAPYALMGRRGTIHSPPRMLAIQECVTGWADTPHRDSIHVGSVRATSAAGPPYAVSLTAGPTPSTITRIAFRYGQDTPERFQMGPYHFTTRAIDDPSDYYDFTPEEEAAMRASPNADKLRREMRTRPLLGDRDGAVWANLHGDWRIRNQALWGTGPRARVQHWQEVACDMDLHARVLIPRESEAVIHLYDDTVVHLKHEGSGDITSTPNHLQLAVPADSAWHAVHIRTRSDILSARVDGAAWHATALIRGHGDRIGLGVAAGSAAFDDIRIEVDRRRPREFFYAFDRRETDWIRRGDGWLDHGGVACALASNWITLRSPDARGMLWHKRTFGRDLAVSLNVAESSEWFGWNQSPSHVHHPYDRVCVVMADAPDFDDGYRLEVNAGRPRRTVLYRCGEEVAAVRQGYLFPIRARYAHAPLSPRRSRLSLIREGDELTAIVNGVEVLRYADPDPLPVSRIGIGGYNTWLDFGHVEIREL